MNTTTTAMGEVKWGGLSGEAREAVLAVRRAAKAYTGDEAVFEVVFGDAVDALIGGETTVFAYLGALLAATKDARPVLDAAFAAGEAMAKAPRRAGP